MHVRDAGRPLQDRARAAKYMHVYTYMSMHVVVKTHLDNSRWSLHHGHMSPTDVSAFSPSLAL